MGEAFSFCDPFSEVFVGYFEMLCGLVQFLKHVGFVLLFSSLFGFSSL